MEKYRQKATVLCHRPKRLPNTTNSDFEVHRQHAQLRWHGSAPAQETGTMPVPRWHQRCAKNFSLKLPTSRHVTPLIGILHQCLRLYYSNFSIGRVVYDSSTNDCSTESFYWLCPAFIAPERPSMQRSTAASRALLPIRPIRQILPASGPSPAPISMP